MDGRTIPGFYFDREKRKYFKIIPGSGGQPDNKYSADNLKKQMKREQAEKAEETRAQKRRKETVVSTQSRNLLSRAYIQREIGYARPSYLMQSMWPSACASGYEAQDIVQPDKIRFFDINSAAGFVYTAGEHDITRRSSKPKDPNDDKMNRIHPYSTYDLQARGVSEKLGRMTSEVSSLHYMPTTGALCVTTKGSDRAPVVYFTDPERDGPYVGAQFTPRDCSVIWTSCPRPVSILSDPGTSVPATTTEKIAVAAQNSLLIYDRTPDGTWVNFAKLPGKADQGDILALCWVSPTVLTLGFRSGRIDIFDTHASGSARLIAHPAPVNQIRRADDFSRIVVSGICNTLCVYDIRAVSRPDTTLPKPSRKYEEKRRRKTSTLPFQQGASKFVNRFREHKNENTPDLGVDVHERLGLVAAADDDDKLRVWNMYSGEVVKTFDVKGRVADRTRDYVRCVRFVEDEAEGVSLWANVNGGVVKYGW